MSAYTAKGTDDLNMDSYCVGTAVAAFDREAQKIQSTQHVVPINNDVICCSIFDGSVSNDSRNGSMLSFSASMACAKHSSSYSHLYQNEQNAEDYLRRVIKNIYSLTSSEIRHMNEDGHAGGADVASVSFVKLKDRLYCCISCLSESSLSIRWYDGKTSSLVTPILLTSQTAPSYLGKRNLKIFTQIKEFNPSSKIMIASDGLSSCFQDNPGFADNIQSGEISLKNAFSYIVDRYPDDSKTLMLIEPFLTN